MEKKKVNVHQFLREVYYHLLYAGYENISIKSEDLSSYVPQMEEIVNASDIDLDDLFIKTPVSETYDKYKDYLISTFIQENVGYFNDRYDTITLVNNPYLIKKNITEQTDSQRIACLCAMEVAVSFEKGIDEQFSNIKTKSK